MTATRLLGFNDGGRTVHQPQESINMTTGIAANPDGTPKAGRTITCRNNPLFFHGIFTHFQHSDIGLTKGKHDRIRSLLVMGAQRYMPLPELPHPVGDSHLPVEPLAPAQITSKMKQKEDSQTLLKNRRDIVSSRLSPGGLVRRVLDGEVLSPPPIWLMRQAGRYLPEYRTARAKVVTFLDLCFDPELAAEVTLQPVRRFDLDAAILFSDILVVPHALGQSVAFVENEGPRLEPIHEAAIDALDSRDPVAALRPVIDTVGLVRERLDDDKTLIGFCGAPWTVATYMIAGRGTPDQAPARRFAMEQPDAFGRLIDRLVAVSADYLVAQIRAGTDVVQIFDSWAGVLDEASFERWCIAPTAAIVARVKAVEPRARVIGFPKGAGLRLRDYVEATGIDGIGIDWTVPVGYAREQLQPLCAIQGNLDPMLLYGGGPALDQALDRICDALQPGRFIFNLGHGILPETPIAHVERLIRRVRQRKA